MAAVSSSRQTGRNISVCNFTIVIDSNEGAPYPFQGLQERGPKKRNLVIPISRRAMYQMHQRDVEIKGEVHRVGLADYSLLGFEQQIQIERKSIADLFGTLGQRRNRFEAEIKRLHEDCEYVEVVIEGDWPAIIRHRGHGPNPQSVIGTIKAWQQRYPRVHWNLYPSRAAAERFVFRALERFWLDRQGS